MKRRFSFLLALLLLCTFCIASRVYRRSEIRNGRDSYVYWNTDVRNQNIVAMREILRAGIPVFGSSELSASDDVAYPPSLFHGGNSDFNMILIGRGYMQSLLHAINVGALEDTIGGRKVALILSPQWFTGSYLVSAFPDRFMERNYAAFLKNEAISYETKVKVSQRVDALLADDPAEQEKVQLYNETLINKTWNPMKWIELGIYDAFMADKSDYDYATEIRDIQAPTGDFVQAADLDFEKLMSDAEAAGNAACTNNNLYIYDSYYDTYIKEGYEEGSSKNSWSDASTDPEVNGTEEYNDLRLFLSVCKETGIEPLIISMPVNGRWYDWIGFPQSERDSYYQRIREICDEYQVELADFSDKEYEPYFLKDIMHCGWKGWVYVDDVVYRFYSADK